MGRFAELGYAATPIGEIKRGTKARITRDGVVVSENVEIAGLRRFKDDVTEVREGFECGINLGSYNDLQLGDLIATCSSPLSRNRSFGERLGRGVGLPEILASTRQVAEGVKSCESIAALARAYSVDMPITDGVVAVVHDGVPPRDMMQALLSRSAKPERLLS